MNALHPKYRPEVVFSWSNNDSTRDFPLHCACIFFVFVVFHIFLAPSVPGAQVPAPQVPAPVPQAPQVPGGGGVANQFAVGMPPSAPPPMPHGGAPNGIMPQAPVITLSNDATEEQIQKQILARLPPGAKYVGKVTSTGNGGALGPSGTGAVAVAVAGRASGPSPHDANEEQIQKQILANLPPGSTYLGKVTRSNAPPAPGPAPVPVSSAPYAPAPFVPMAHHAPPEPQWGYEPVALVSAGHALYGAPPPGTVSFVTFVWRISGDEIAQNCCF
jgi:hypothetical protein